MKGFLVWALNTFDFSLTFNYGHFRLAAHWEGIVSFTGFILGGGYIFILFLAFLKYISLWEDVGGPEKDRVLCFPGDGMAFTSFRL